MKKCKKHHRSTYARARAIRAIAAEHYEPGNNRRCHKQVWRRFVLPTIGCCYNTYISLVHLPPEPPEPPADDPRQLKLF